MADISKFILKIMALLAWYSLVGVIGAVIITGAHEDATGAGAAVGWVTLCALLYLLCVDRLTIAGARRHG